MRSAILAAAAILAACGGPGSGQKEDAAAQVGLIECAIGGAARLERVCRIERRLGAEGLILTVRHADGGFRRFLVATDGRGVTAADGAEQPAVVPAGNRSIEVRIGTDSYRLPATFLAGRH